MGISLKEPVEEAQGGDADNGERKVLADGIGK